MAIRKVAQLGHPVLRRKAESIDPRHVDEDEVQQLIDDLIETMREYDGVGLAAPQVHASLRLVVYDLAASRRKPAAASRRLVVLVNPRLTRLDDDMEEDWEGCLSLPDLRGRVPRYLRMRVRALDREGRRLDFVAKDFHARVVQHECDHLDGKVFLDRMRDLSSLAFLPEFLRHSGVEDDVD